MAPVATLSDFDFIYIGICLKIIREEKEAGYGGVDFIWGRLYKNGLPPSDLSELNPDQITAFFRERGYKVTQWTDDDDLIHSINEFP